VLIASQHGSSKGLFRDLCRSIWRCPFGQLLQSGVCTARIIEIFLCFSKVLSIEKTNPTTHKTPKKLVPSEKPCNDRSSNPAMPAGGRSKQHSDRGESPGADL